MVDRLYFTESDEANELIASDPMALLIGFALDQQVSVQKAFSGPLAIGSASARSTPTRSPSPTSTRSSGEKPAVHRFPGAMAARVHELAVHVRDEYGGDAERVWADAGDAAALRANFAGLPGFGEMKVKALGRCWPSASDVAAAGARAWHPTLGDVDSPEALAEYQAAKRAHKLSWRASTTR